MRLSFGDYCNIEQKRFSGDNVTYTYKVIGASQANYYREVPVDASAPHNTRGGPVVDVVKVICCGVCEEQVETFRLKDVKSVNT